MKLENKLHVLSSTVTTYEYDQYDFHYYFFIKLISNLCLSALQGEKFEKSESEWLIHGLLNMERTNAHIFHILGNIDDSKQFFF